VTVPTWPRTGIDGGETSTPESQSHIQGSFPKFRSGAVSGKKTLAELTRQFDVRARRISCGTGII
jgi:hypothetical protein